MWVSKFIVGDEAVFSVDFNATFVTGEFLVNVHAGKMPSETAFVSKDPVTFCTFDLIVVCTPPFSFLRCDAWVNGVILLYGPLPLSGLFRIITCRRNEDCR